METTISPEGSGSVPTNAQNTPLFTCMACQVAFYSADQQRAHYRSDWHRYNLKRKVADLPPVTAESFAERVLAQQAKSVEDAKKAGYSGECTVCKKAYVSENGFNNHLNSKKHKETEAKMVAKMQAEEDMRAEQAAIAESIANISISPAAASAAADEAQQQGAADTAAAATATVDADNVCPTSATSERKLKVSNFPLGDEDDSDDDEEEEVNASLNNADQPMDEQDAERTRRKQERELKQQLHQATSEEEVVKLLEKKKATAPRLNPDSDCLFCTHKSDSFDSNMAHMSLAHSLFIPDLEYIVDLRGLIKYLADKLSVANVCLYCNGRGRALQSLDAVRKHMLDKGHTKLAYDTEIDVLEISDFYDFSSTYPDADEHDADEELDAAGGALVRTTGRPTMSGTLEEEDGELVLPSGNRIGHRALHRYYKQSIPLERPEKDSVVIHKMLTNYSENPQFSNQLMQSRQNRAMVLAMPNGRQALKDFATFKEKRTRQDFTNRIGMKMNNLQKYFREANPL
ncbi:pre-60S factor rei1 [Kickxella alabastrina]|uniref:Pre-60S factor rei1 n=1 Tax=Kickxella alabastrina TaxID=61397 RepID=A0ACC1IRD1_9FUNG|nr:pre-60S factor rei1 [Kickxella alabastrina]